MPDLEEETAESQGSTTKSLPDIIFEESDLPYEEDILRNPFSLRCWLRYLDHKKTPKTPPKQLNLIYERAIKELPGSYKLWYNYLKLRRKQARSKCVVDPVYEDVNNCFERGLVFMHKMPRIWLDYCQFLMDQCLVTRTRKSFDRALRALPITQHDRIWPLYLKFVRMHNIPETAIRVYRRYLKICPENREELIEFMIEIDRLDDAAVLLAKLVNDDRFVSKEGKSNHQLWTDLCELICKNPDKITSLKVEPIIRQGIKRYTDQVGKLWCSLAEYYIRAGLFYKARDIYEESIQTVMTVRDFTQVFDAYAQFEERLASAKMEEAAKKPEGPTPEEDMDIEIRLARFEYLMDRRPLLLNNVLLRQNPHNVHEWLKRVELYKDHPEKVIDTFTEAVQTVQPKLQTGKLNALWIAFAKFYEENEQFDDTKEIFKKALQVPYTKVDDLAQVWCEFAEFYLRHNDIEGATKLMKQSTAPPHQKTHYFDETEAVQNRVYKSLKLWSMYADLEESFGTLESCKRVYDRILDLKIATPQIVINYGMFLEEHNHFEEAFKGGKKLERARDLFEQCLETCPPKFAKNIYLAYGKLEEEHGLARHAMSIYNRATQGVEKEEMYEMFNIYIKKAAEMYGIAHTRPIYEKAIDVLPEDRARDMCLRFSELEKKLGEIDRARAVYSHCAQMCDPRIHPRFWEIWKDFEVKHGNEDTVREMLRIKRSVQATYNTQVNFMSAQMLAAAGGASKPVDELTAGDSMALLEAKAAKMAAEEVTSPGIKKPSGGVSFVRGETIEPAAEASAGKRIVEERNPEEIQIDDIEDDEEEEEEEEEDEENRKKPKRKSGKDVAMERQTIPSEVFGSLAVEEDD